MFDDFRKQTDETAFPEEKPEDTLAGEFAFDQRPQRFLGMTAPQRFVIAFMLLLMTVILGTFCLLVTSKIVLPFFG
jgi:hypothetical protein